MPNVQATDPLPGTKLEATIVPDLFAGPTGGSDEPEAEAIAACDRLPTKLCIYAALEEFYAKHCPSKHWTSIYSMVDAYSGTKQELVRRIGDKHDVHTELA